MVSAKELFAKAGRGGLAPLQKALSPLELLRLARADFGGSIFSSQSPILQRGAHNMRPVASFFGFGESKTNSRFYSHGVLMALRPFGDRMAAKCQKMAPPEQNFERQPTKNISVEAKKKVRSDKISGEQF